MITEEELLAFEAKMERSRAGGVWHYLVEQEDVVRLIGEIRRLKDNSKRREDEWCAAVQGVREAIQQNYPGEPAEGYYGELLADAERLLRARRTT